MSPDKLKVECSWKEYKTGIQSDMDTYIPSKTYKKNG